jgi:ATP-dependent DNA ligase
VSYTDDGEVMHQATLAVGAEGTVSKKTPSIYIPGQRVRWWLKTNTGEPESFPSSAGGRPRRFGPAV